MIKLERIEKPVQLTDEKQRNFTEDFKKTGKSVWNRTYIKEQLLKMSHNKCCYCEVALNTESKYVEVEHFQYKNEYKDFVVDWDNLLPSCKRCNGKKGEHDVVKEPIINPTELIPKEHIYLKGYRLYPKTEIGKTSIDVLFLNDRKHLVTPRFELGNGLVDRLDDILDFLNDYISGINKTIKRKNKIIERLQNLMSEAVPQAEFSATSSTTILTEPLFKEIKSKLISLKLWTSEFEELEKEMEFCSLIK